MAWTSPMTFVPGAVLTAAQMNTHLRDNLLELAPAKATTAGSWFVGSGVNKIEERIPKTARVDATESMAKTEYRDLTTSGPKVTVSTGTHAIVFLSARMGAFTLDDSCAMGYDITGATKVDASDDRALYTEGIHAQKDNRWCQMIVETELKPGQNTFTCKYKAGSTDTTSTWGHRFIAVWPF